MITFDVSERHMSLSVPTIFGISRRKDSRPKSIYPNMTKFSFPTLFLSVTILGLKNISQKWTAFVFDNSYLHQTFTEYVSNQYTHFDILTSQMWPQVMEWLLNLLRFFGYFHKWLLTIHVWSVVSSPNFHRFTDCVSDKCTHFDMSTCQMWL